jgi:aspartyl/asparaginyl-tRNA synthetase
MEVIESMIKYIIKYVLENAPEEMEFFNKFIDTGLLDRLNNVVNSDFGKITYEDAIKELEKHNSEFNTLFILELIFKQSMKNIYVKKYLENLFLLQIIQKKLKHFI